MEPARSIEEYQEQIAEIRAQSNRRRAGAWAMVPEAVLGIELNPITPAIHSLLLGIGNAYFTGRVPQESDLRNFVWFCSPQFNPDHPLASRRWKWLQMARLKVAIGQRRGRSRQDAVLGNFYRACLQIHRIIGGTFRDGPAASHDGSSRMIAASMEAQIIDMFAREYRQWPLPQPVRHTPIKQLYQLARCIDRRSLGSEAKYNDADENACTRRFLEAVNSRN